MSDVKTQEVRIRELVGEAIEKSLKQMIAGEEVTINAAILGRAMDWLGGKGQKPGGSGSGEVDPFEQAMATLNAGRTAGKAMPQLSDDDDPATS